ncbi:MAG: hypothetical protein U0M60_04090 [Clostridia bacterium]|nr:hypothetical protein [Clostridia bacterium]
MWRRKCCGGKNRFPTGLMLIALGIGILLAYIIPYYVLIAMLGIGLIAAGIWFIRKK